MFQTWLVKIAKIDAASRPSRLPGNRAMNPVTVIDRNPSTGTDCRMSSKGTRIFSARRLWAASDPYTRVNRVAQPRAMNIRRVDRRA